jgi:tRNA (cmo5U34)-methyltransferase
VEALMGQFHWDPASYLQLMEEEVPDYKRLQGEVAQACVLAVHPAARLIGVDASEGMLAVARDTLAAHTPAVDLRRGRLEDPLPEGPFDVVFSALAVHHLNGQGKAILFARVAEVLRRPGRFVLGDVVIPVDPADVVTPIDDDGYDMPSSVADQLEWLEAAGFDAHVAWASRDLAVLVGDLRV